MTERASGRLVAHFDVYARATDERREMDHAGVPNRASGYRAPRDLLIRLEPRCDRIPLHCCSCGSHKGPMRLSVRSWFDTSHVTHEAREVLVVCEELKNLFDRRVDPNRLLDVDGAVAVYAGEAPQGLVGRTAQQNERA